MSNQGAYEYIQAVRDFRQARQRAALEQVIGGLRGEPTELLSYEQVRRQLRAVGELPRQLCEIPISSIVGSVGRYTDFTRSFLPRDPSDEARWARVKALAEGAAGYPPIEVYQIGGSYFVRDGHHRVSVARAVGADTIEAYVTEIRSRVPLSPSDNPTDICLKAERTEFLDETGLDRSRPAQPILLTTPGTYPQLLVEIEQHRQWMERQAGGSVASEQAAVDWFDNVYLPRMSTIRRRGLLRDFPERTEADLYLWVRKHEHELRQALGWEVEPEQAVENLASSLSRLPPRWFGRVWTGLQRWLIPSRLQAGPPAGDWRERVVAKREDRRLFHDVLVGISAESDVWHAVDQAITIASFEASRVLGLHVASDPEDSQLAATLEQEFRRRCAQAGVRHGFSLQRGVVADRLVDQARWTDLIVLQLTHPPDPDPGQRLGSGARRLIQQSPRPLLLVRGAATEMSNLLLAFDGKPKSWEALYVAAYWTGTHAAKLTLLVSEEPDLEVDHVLLQALDYLDGVGIRPDSAVSSGPVADAILTQATQAGCDTILMGGYSAGPVVEAFAGSTLNDVLLRTELPILICR